MWLNFSHKASQEMVAAAVVPQLRRCKLLAADFARYDAADDDSPDHSLAFIYNAAKRMVERKKREDMSQGMLKPVKTAVVQSYDGKHKPICPYYFKNGTCRDDTSCPLQHVAGAGKPIDPQSRRSKRRQRRNRWSGKRRR